MIDISFSELALIAVVALIVVGPERLPKVARTMGHMLGRLQRYVNEVKADINREMELDELRKLQGQMQDAARGLQQSVTGAAQEFESTLHESARTIHDEVAAPAQQAAAEAQGALKGDTQETSAAQPPAAEAAVAHEPVQSALPGLEPPSSIPEPPHKT